MPALTPSFLFDLESNLRKIVDDEYSRLASDLWWSKVAKVRPSSSKREILTWLLSTAQIEDQGLGGNMSFEDMVMRTTEFTNKDSGNGLKLRRQQFEDLDGNGVDIASQWARDTAAYMAYWPQKQVVAAMKAGETGLAYDGKAFFATNHPVDGGSSSTTYSNLLTSSVDISAAVSAAVALENLQSVFAHIASIKMPNGEDPRRLRPAGLIVPPKLYGRAVQLTSAKSIAQAVGSAGGSADVEALIKSLGYGTPIMADEFAGFESDTTYFVVAEQVSTSQLGAMVYSEREPYRITYYTGQGGGTGADAVLDRAQELEWHNHGRNVTAYGHPFLLFKCKA